MVSETQVKKEAETPALVERREEKSILKPESGSIDVPEVKKEQECSVDESALHNVAKRPFGISISERLYLFSRTPSGAPNGSPALTYKWTTQLLKEIAPPWPLDLSEGHGGGPGVVGDEQH